MIVMNNVALNYKLIFHTQINNILKHSHLDT